MRTGMVYDKRFLEHDTGPSHPERAARLEAIVERLHRDRLWEQLIHLPVRPADPEWVLAVHDQAYVERIRMACERGARFVDVADSAICPSSYEVALLAVGGTLCAVDAVMGGTVDTAFCAVRPPGHHAERDASMGFCLLNNVAIAAEYLQHRHGLRRIAIVDFDVHHGNGTQHIFEQCPEVLFISMHEHPTFLYPGSGFAWEQGRERGSGHTLNLPVEPGAGDDVFQALMELRVVPAINAFEPQFILLSAGFDASEHDPLAHLCLSVRGYEKLTQRLMQLAHRHCDGNLVSCLEGGYDLRALAECAAAHVACLMSDPGEDSLMSLKAGL